MITGRRDDTDSAMRSPGNLHPSRNKVTSESGQDRAASALALRASVSEFDLCPHRYSCGSGSPEKQESGQDRPTWPH